MWDTHGETPRFHIIFFFQFRHFLSIIDFSRPFFPSSPDAILAWSGPLQPFPRPSLHARQRFSKRYQGVRQALEAVTTRNKQNSSQKQQLRGGVSPAVAPQPPQGNIVQLPTDGFRAACVAGVFVSREGERSCRGDCREPQVGMARNRLTKAGGEGKANEQPDVSNPAFKSKRCRAIPAALSRPAIRRVSWSRAAQTLPRRSRAPDAPRFVVARQRQSRRHRQCRDC